MKKSVLFLLLCFVGFHPLYAEEFTINFLRHLENEWPRTNKLTENKGIKSHRRLSSRFNKYIRNLNEVKNLLLNAQGSPCKSTQLQSLDDLLLNVELKRAELTNCLEDCLALENRLINLNILFEIIYQEAQNCVRSKDQKQFLWDKQSQRKLKSYLSWGTNRQDALAALSWAHRNSNYWNQLQLNIGAYKNQESAYKLTYGLKDQWIYQPSKNVYSLKANINKEYPFFVAPSFSDLKGSQHNFNIEGEWSFPVGNQRWSLASFWNRQNWQEGAWTNRQMGGLFSYYFYENNEVASNFYLGFSSTALSTELANVGITRLGVLIKNNRFKDEGSFFRIGVQDRRTKDLGASVWPELEIYVLGDDLFYDGLLPTWGVQVLPQETPWSFHALHVENRMGFEYRKGNLLIPLWAAVARDFHHKSTGPHRTDLVLRGSFAPSYRLLSGLALEIPIEWQNFWFQSFNEVEAASAQTFEVRVKVIYEL